MFFLRRLMECKSFSMLIILIDHWQVLSYLTRIPMLNQANHAIWQKSWSISIVLTVFSGILEVNASKEKRKSISVFVLNSKTKLEDDKLVLQRVSFEISREWQGLLLQSRKMAKRWQSFWKTHWNYREIEFHEFLSERSELFRSRSGQASDKFATGPAPYKNRTKDFFESLL